MLARLVLLRFAPIVLARIWAIVVLPSPGGPLNKIWSIASLRCRAAATVISNRSFTLAWPVNSENKDGRSVISSATSGLVRTSEIVRSAITNRMRNGRSGARRNRLLVLTQVGLMDWWMMDD